jgi:hypothetical protein
MPFLFVDYDPGAGGEKFCAELSRSDQCEKLTYETYCNGRTKIHDVYSQEFLKPNPEIIDIKQSHPTLYTIVPTHQQTDLAKSLLKDVYSIRIQMPTDPVLHSRVVEHRINKVLLTREPTQEYFFGLLKILTRSTNNRDFVKKVKYKMTTIEIILLSQGQEPTPAAIEQYLNKLRSAKHTEPDQPYDLIIPYEQLVSEPDQVYAKLNSTFGITVVGNWLSTYA